MLRLTVSEVVRRCKSVVQGTLFTCDIAQLIELLRGAVYDHVDVSDMPAISYVWDANTGTKYAERSSSNKRA